jgi:hypothetical protein
MTFSFRLEQPVEGAVEILAPAGALARTAGPLGPAPAVLAPDGVERGVGAALEVEVVDHEPRPGQLVLDRLAVGVEGRSIPRRLPATAALTARR